MTLDPLEDGRCPYCRFLPPNQDAPSYHPCSGRGNPIVTIVNGHAIRGVLEEVAQQCKPGKSPPS